MPNEILILQNKVEELERRLNSLSNPAEISPQDVLGMSARILLNDDELVTAHDVAVDEAGAGSYTVQAVADGYKRTPDGLLIPYYNPA